jgi:hypothetical protein
MLNVKLNKDNDIAILEPDGALSKDDFISACKIIDPYIEKEGKLNGIIIYVESFPGWDSFSALITHLKFIKDHHTVVTHVALVTNSPIGSFAEHIAGHFVCAEIKGFRFDELNKAKEWITTDHK